MSVRSTVAGLWRGTTDLTHYEGCRLVVGHRLEIIIDHWLESVAVVDAIF